MRSRTRRYQRSEGIGVLRIENSERKGQEREEGRCIGSRRLRIHFQLQLRVLRRRGTQFQTLQAYLNNPLKLGGFYGSLTIPLLIDKLQHHLRASSAARIENGNNHNLLEILV